MNQPGEKNRLAEEIEITTWLASAYDFYARVVKDC